MKKLSIAIASMAIAFGSYSCDNTSTSTPSSERDSVAYALGVLQGDGLLQRNQYAEQAGGAKTDTKAFIKGIKEGLADSTLISYAEGVQMGAQIAKLFAEDSINSAHFVRAMESKLNGDSTSILISDSLAQALLQNYGETRAKREREKQFGANKEKGAEYKKNFEKEEGVQVTASGLAYKVEKAGTGATPTLEDKVKVKYKGTTIDGNTFDENTDGIEFALSGVVKGWTEMLQLMKEGEKVKVVIPYELAYGESGTYGIDPYSTLVFEIELVQVLKGAAKSDSHSGHNH